MNYIQLQKIYESFTLLVSILIVFHYALSTYYGIKMIIVKEKQKFGWCPEMLVTYESALWVILFTYIVISIVIDKPVINPLSFGATFIRPLILISAVITAILQRRRYKKAHTKFILEDFYKEKLKKLEQED